MFRASKYGLADVDSNCKPGRHLYRGPVSGTQTLVASRLRYAKLWQSAVASRQRYAKADSASFCVPSQVQYLDIYHPVCASLFTRERRTSAMITCKRCKSEKPDIEFLEAHGRGRGPAGRFLWCRHCRDTQLSSLNELNRRKRNNQKDSALAKLHRDEMMKIERMRRRMSEITGVEHHLEHVVPLNGTSAQRPVCGLHVPWNVALSSAALNMAKGAKFSHRDAERVEKQHIEWMRARDLAL
jgi:hypothetical protein